MVDWVFKGNYYDNLDYQKILLDSHGQKSWIYSLYDALYSEKPELAREWFDELRNFYHPLVVDALLKGIFKTFY